jgi:hypothetical protein
MSIVEHAPTVQPAATPCLSRSTKAETAERRQGILDIVRGQQPMTCRQVFYRATVFGLVPKSEKGYLLSNSDLRYLRRSGDIPYDWIVDNTRQVLQPKTYIGVQAALEETAADYYKKLWHNSDEAVMVFVEKDALSGVLWPVTSEYDVPLIVARGYNSLSALHVTAKALARAADAGQRTNIYYFGDLDPSGVDACRAAQKTLREMTPDADVHFERVAVTREQAEEWDLPSRPTKTTDSRAKSFEGESVELDAIEPDDLRQLVRNVIRRHMPDDRFDQLMVEQDEERRLIRDLVNRLGEQDTAQARLII